MRSPLRRSMKQQISLEFRYPEHLIDRLSYINSRSLRSFYRNMWYHNRSQFNKRRYLWTYMDQMRRATLHSFSKQNLSTENYWEVSYISDSLVLSCYVLYSCYLSYNQNPLMKRYMLWCIVLDTLWKRRTSNISSFRAMIVMSQWLELRMQIETWIENQKTHWEATSYSLNRLWSAHPQRNNAILQLVPRQQSSVSSLSLLNASMQ